MSRTIFKIEIREVGKDWIWLGKLTADGVAEVLKVADHQNDLIPVEDILEHQAKHHAPGESLEEKK